MTHPIPHIGGGAAIVPVLDETIWPDGDLTVTGWVDEGASTSNLYQSVDSDGDSDYVELENWILDTTVRIALYLESPSTDPATVGQDGEVRIKAMYLENFEALPNDPLMFIRLDEGGTQRATSTAITLSTDLTEHSLILSQAEINSVTDWTDAEIDLLFDNSANTGADEEAKFRVSRERLIFS